MLEKGSGQHMLTVVAFLLSHSTFNMEWQTAVPCPKILCATKSRGDLASSLLFLFRNNLCKKKCAVTMTSLIVEPRTSERDCT